MKQIAQTGWSDALIAQTRLLMESPPLRLGPALSMKNIDGRFGTIAMGGAPSDSCVVMDKETGERFPFTTFDAMVLAGWAVD